MQYTKLGSSDMQVSKICLGTMTFGEQNTLDEAHAQLDYAIEQGINFIDTAEMYSVPGRSETQGSTETILGHWLTKNPSLRKEIILATKVTGPAPIFQYIAPNLGFSKARIHDALDKSLSRLRTDYIDLYQLHWPERQTNFFGKLGYTHDSEWQDNFQECMETLESMQKEGRIRAWGLSNETPWGVMRTCSIADHKQWPRPLTIQNPYNLLNRSYEIGLAEITMREHIGMLAYSPLAFGMLTGKYHNGTDQPQDRINQFKRLSRYNGTLSKKATADYMLLASQYGFSMSGLSLAYVYSRPFVDSTIIGATTMVQLKENIDAIQIVLPDTLLQQIDDIHLTIPNPAP